MLTIIVIFYVVIIFPLFINIKFNLIEDVSNINYKLKLYFIPILFGKVEFIKEGIAFHINNKKVIILEFNKIFTIRKKFKPLKDYHIIKFNSSVALGDINYKTNLIYISLIISYFTNYFGTLIKQIKPHFNLKNNIYLFEDKNIFELRMKGVIVLNLLMILISVIKIVMEKIIYAIKN